MVAVLEEGSARDGFSGIRVRRVGEGMWSERQIDDYALLPDSLH